MDYRSNILTNGVIFSTLKHTDSHTVRGRSTQKDGVCNEHIFRNGSFRGLKIAKEWNDLADLAKAESYQKSNEFLVNRKCGQNVATDDRRTFTDKDKVRRIQTLGKRYFSPLYCFIRFYIESNPNFCLWIPSFSGSPSIPPRRSTAVFHYCFFFQYALSAVDIRHW